MLRQNYLTSDVQNSLNDLDCVASGMFGEGAVKPEGEKENAKYATKTLYARRHYRQLGNR